MAEKIEVLSVRQSADYKAYIEALCRIAEEYVPRIRVQFAQRADEMYQDETVRKIVLAYGAEHEKLEARRLRDFTFAVEHPGTSLEHDCLNHARHYAQTVKMLFDIK